MRRPRWRSVVVLGVLLSLSALSACNDGHRTARRMPERPNFIVLFADDLGYGDLSCYGHPSIKTPNLDRMAREGMRFTDFYVAAPICTPSRAALLTGRYPIRSGMTRVLFPGSRKGLPADEITVAEVLKDMGYATACIGKWHLGRLPEFRPTRHGFDAFYGLLVSNDMGPRPGKNRPPVGLYRDDDLLEAPADQDSLTRRYTEEAIRFIRAHPDTPFFLYLPHTMPHVPVAASRQFRGKSARGLYGDAVEEIDWGVGEILKTLQQTGLDDRTLVLFTSDNGPALNHGYDGGSAGLLRGGKWSTWEGGMRVPCIARWPGRVPAGRVNSALCSAMDFLPTLVYLAGGDPARYPNLDGKNIAQLLEGGTTSPHSVFYYYLKEDLHAVRAGRWKLHVKKQVEIRSEEGAVRKRQTVICDPPELYDLLQDPAERFPVQARYPEVAARLLGLLRAFDREIAGGE